MENSPFRHTPQQSRSQQRTDLILDTAADLFVEVGYEVATTNAIAERAGISIGSLYRYFPDKQAILRALADRHLNEIRALYDRVFSDEALSLSLDALLDRLVDPFVALHTTCPVYAHLLLSVDASCDIATAAQAFEQESVARVAAFLRRVAPGLDEAQAQLAATVCKATVRALVSLVASSAEEGFEQQVSAEFKRMLAGYLGPMILPPPYTGPLLRSP